MEESEEEYEYDTPSDSDDDECPYENVWNEVYKRIKINNGKIHVKIGENDDPSVLVFLSEIINKGVSGEFLSYQLQIEQRHNAIIWNPSKGNPSKGNPSKRNNRIKEMRKLEELCAESTEPLTSEVYGLEIPNSNGFDFTFPNLKFLTIGSPDKKIIEKLRPLPKLEYLTIEGRMPIFTMFEGFDSLELLTLKNIQNSYQITNLVCGSATSRYITIHAIDMQIPEFIAVLFKSNRVQCTNITVNCEKKSVDYQEWKIKENSQPKKYRHCSN